MFTSRSEANINNVDRLPSAESATWPEAFVNPVAAAEQFKKILKSIGVEF